MFAAHLIASWKCLDVCRCPPHPRTPQRVDCVPRGPHHQCCSGGRGTAGTVGGGCKYTVEIEQQSSDLPYTASLAPYTKT